MTPVKCCANCAFCRRELFTDNHSCVLNRYVGEIDRDVNWTLHTPQCMICKNFLPFETAMRMDEVGSLEEFRMLTSIGAWEGVSGFVVESKLNSFLCDRSATQKQLRFAAEISRNTGRIPPTAMSGQMFPTGEGGDYSFGMVNSKQMLMKYIGENVHAMLTDDAGSRHMADRFRAAMI